MHANMMRVTYEYRARHMSRFASNHRHDDAHRAVTSVAKCGTAPAQRRIRSLLHHVCGYMMRVIRPARRVTIHRVTSRRFAICNVVVQARTHTHPSRAFACPRSMRSNGAPRDRRRATLRLPGIDQASKVFLRDLISHGFQRITRQIP